MSVTDRDLAALLRGDACQCECCRLHRQIEDDLGAQGFVFAHRSQVEPPAFANGIERHLWFVDRLRDRGIDPMTIHGDDLVAAYHGRPYRQRRLELGRAAA